MGFRILRPFLLRLRASFTATGIEGRGAWSTTRPRPTGHFAGEELSYVIIEQGHKPFKALGLVLLMIMLAALAFVVAAQG